MKTVVSKLFVDTNILVYAINTTSKWHKLARAALEDATNTGSELVISPQVLREYLTAATRPPPSGAGVALTSALSDYRQFRSQFTVLHDNSSTLDALDSLLKTTSAIGRQIYDANIVATMQAYGVKHLLTHNVADFARFAGVITVIPLVKSTP